MSIATELQNYADGLDDAYDAVNDMSGIIPQHKNMNNLDQAIRTIPQNQGTTYTAGTGIDITSDVISVDNTTVPFFTDLATVATTGDYGDLLNTPTIPAAQVNSDWNANSGVAQILNKPSLATVATSGLYSDLTGTPSLATVATSGDYDDLLNKPTIPTVNDATLTIQHNGTNVQTFTANQGTNATANIETIWADDIAPATQVPPITSSLIDWSTMEHWSIDVSSNTIVTQTTAYGYVDVPNTSLTFTATVGGVYLVIINAAVKCVGNTTDCYARVLINGGAAATAMSTNVSGQFAGMGNARAFTATQANNTAKIQIGGGRANNDYQIAGNGLSSVQIIRIA